MGTDAEQLGRPDAAAEAPQAEQQKKPSLISRIIAWLTAGYPEGIPAADRFAVIAVLKRRLTDQDIHDIVEQLTGEGSPARADGKITHDEVETLLARVLHEQPTQDEIRRVSARLAAGGWPLGGPHDQGSDGERADDQRADDQGSDGEVADDQGADDQGADDQGADDQGADDQVADTEPANNEVADDQRAETRPTPATGAARP